MRCKRNYYIFILVAFFQGCCFYAPVATLYRLNYGLSLSQLFIIESISWLLCIGLELPMGYFADRFGHRKTVVMGCLVYFVSKIVFALAGSFALFMLERVLLAIAGAALSGAVESLLYESVEPDKAERRFAAYNAAGTLGLLGASIASPLLYQVSLRNAAYATALTYGIAALLCLFLREPESAAARTAEPAARASSAVPGVRAAVKSLASDRQLLRFLLALAVCLEFAQASTVFLSQPQYKRAGIAESSYGLLFALIQCAALAGSAVAGLVNRRQDGAARTGRRRLTIMGAATALECGACVCLALWPVPGLSVAALLVFSAAAAAQRPLSTAIQVERSGVANRATSLSLNAMLGELVSAVLNPVEGLIAENALKTGFAAFAGVLALILLVSPWLFAVCAGTAAAKAPAAPGMTEQGTVQKTAGALPPASDSGRQRAK